LEGISLKETKELIGLSYSPWTEKARWALDHHKLPYRYREHTMIFGMPLLRWKLHRFIGEVTVPALIDRSGDQVHRLIDSWEIALHADRIGRSKKLFPESQLAELRRWNELSEEGLSAGRALLCARMRDDPEALREALPPYVPGFMRKPLLFIAWIGLSYVVREFETGKKSLTEHEADLREVLQSLRMSLPKGKNYLFGDFSYADIAMAAMFQFVKPVANEYVPLGPATRRVFHHEKVASEFPDLLEWRDQIYQRHRTFRENAISKS
jgi:glutathione S-transferase